MRKQFWRCYAFSTHKTRFSISFLHLWDALLCPQHALYELKSHAMLARWSISSVLGPYHDLVSVVAQTRGQKQPALLQMLHEPATRCTVQGPHSFTCIGKLAAFLICETLKNLLSSGRFIFYIGARCHLIWRVIIRLYLGQSPLVATSSRSPFWPLTPVIGRTGQMFLVYQHAQHLGTVRYFEFYWGQRHKKSDPNV